MITTIVSVQVKADCIDGFIEATRLNHMASVQESGNFRFDVAQNVEHPTHFVLYEAYTTEAAALEHKSTAHYAAWRDSVASMMAQPRQGVKFNLLFPDHA